MYVIFFDTKYNFVFFCLFFEISDLNHINDFSFPIQKLFQFESLPFKIIQFETLLL